MKGIFYLTKKKDATWGKLHLSDLYGENKRRFRRPDVPIRNEEKLKILSLRPHYNN